MSVYQATCTAPVNIAVIKYWGKRDTKLVLPTNDSLSVTLDQDHLRTVTTARADASFGTDEAGTRQDKLWLNGAEESIKPGGRLDACLCEMRKLRAELEAKDRSLPPLSKWGLRLCSENNFPTAAGLASSASGFAALAVSVAELYGLRAVMTSSQLSIIARRGSGSACRSVLGGFVAWQMGTADDGSDSFAIPIAEREHWPDLHVLICVVNDAKKGTSSTVGMQNTVETSPLLQHRIKHVVPERMQQMNEAIQKRDFAAFTQLTTADSNNFHACCLDTTPPIFYMNDTSRAIVHVVEELNRARAEAGEDPIAAYTFDAGPNAVLYVREKDMLCVRQVVQHYFPGATMDDRLQGAANDASEAPASSLSSSSLSLPLPSSLPATFRPDVVPVHPAGSVRRLIHTRVGDGPRVLEHGQGPESLLSADGMPVRTK